MNIVILQGSLAADPKWFTTKNSKRWCSAPVKTQEWSTYDGGKWEYERNNANFFGKVADLMEGAAEGDGIIVTGKLQTRKKDDRYYTSVLVEKVELTPGGGGSKEPPADFAGGPSDDDIPF